MQLLDSRNTTSPLPLRAYLLSTDRVPLVIGMEDVLTECQLCSDFPHNIAYLEFP